MVSPPCAARRTPRTKPVSAIARPFGETPSGRFWAFKGSFARLARTRRSVRSSRGRPLADGRRNVEGKFAVRRDVQRGDTQYAVMLNSTRTRNSNDFVRHATSPSRRDKARQVVTPNVLKFDRRRPKHQTTVQPLRHSLRPPQLSLAHSAFPAGSTVSHLSFFFKATKHECFA